MRRSCATCGGPLPDPPAGGLGITRRRYCSDACKRRAPARTGPPDAVAMERFWRDRYDGLAVRVRRLLAVLDGDRGETQHDGIAIADALAGLRAWMGATAGERDELRAGDRERGETMFRELGGKG